MSVPETCRCCSALTQLDQGICAACSKLHGPRVARLLARCQADAEFASTCLAQLPEPARSRFAAALGAKCIAPKSGPGLRYTRPALELKKRASA
jgi:formate-dependent nitrite reductase cytochrome c552 subunit